MQFFSGLFGGSQKKQAMEARRQQAIANDRQLQAQNAATERTAVSRAAPRGRRLFESTRNQGLAETLGG